MKKVVLIIPYFGKKPENIDIFLEACKNNNTIDWLIFSDCVSSSYSKKNICINNICFEDFVAIVKKKLSCDITINSAYKICDFRPLFGMLFQDYITEYDYWGYCDIFDCIFGDIRKYITDDILESYDKIGYLGHLSIFKNKDEVNSRYKLKSGHLLDYQTIINNNYHYAFDENFDYGINRIYINNGYSIYNISNISVDISPMVYKFEHAYINDEGKFYKKDNYKFLISYENGKLYKNTIIDNKICKEEILYAHFQKRKMDLSIDNYNKYLITPSGFYNYEHELTIKKILDYNKNKMIYKQYFILKYRNLIKKIKYINGSLK